MDKNELYRTQRDNETRVRIPMLLGTQENVQELLLLAEVPEDATDHRVVFLSRAADTISYLACDELIRQMQVRNVSEVLVIGAGEDFKDCLFTAAVRRGYMNIRVGTSEDLVFE